LKRLFVVLLALIYFVAGSGLLLRQHYCMGDFVSAQISLVPNAPAELCGDCGMEEEESGGCCESKTQFVKKAFEQQVSDVQYISSLDVQANLLPIFVIPSVSASVLSEPDIVYNLYKPPPKQGSIFKEYCCFRI
jgi:hypothetical protein